MSAMTFEEAKARTAGDLRTIAGKLIAEADAIQAGDLQRMEALLGDKLPLWFDMLALRYAHVTDERFAKTETA